MSKFTNLVRRNAVYYFRARVPQDIVDTFGKTEVTFSLKTKDHKEAVAKLRKESAKVEADFDAHRRELARLAQPQLEDITPEQYKLIRDTYYRYLLEEDETTRIEGFYSGELTDTPKPEYEEYVEDSRALNEYTKKQYARGVQDVFSSSEAEEVLSWDGIQLNVKKGSTGFKKVIRAIQEADIQAQESIEHRNAGSVVDTPEEPQKPFSESPVESEELLLSEIMEEWIEDKSRSSWKGNKTPTDHRTAVTNFIELIGDKPYQSYTKPDARRFRKALLGLPANWKRKVEFRGLNIEQAARKAKTLGIPPMAEKNASKTLGFVSSLWTWLEAHYDVEKHIFKGLSIKTKSDPRKERNPFTKEELQTLFSTSIYKDQAPTAPDDPLLYWPPLIALYSGMRSGEILQLHVGDITQENDIHYFSIDEGAGKTLKTSNSHRKIPIHQTLVDFGFLEFVSKRSSTRLFPEAQRGDDDTYSKPYSKSFSKHLTALGIKHKKNSFHSFRHNFEDACRNNGVPKGIMYALQGHAEQGMSGRYGAGYSLDVLNEGLQKVAYDGLKLP